MIFKATNALMHYASKYYDPVKAHEYYMRTRELVGRRSTKGMTDEQKEQWKESQFHIKRDRKFELDAVRNQKNQRIKQFRENARRQNLDISKSVKAKIKQLTEQAKNRRENLTKTGSSARDRISNRRDSATRGAIPLMPVPKNASIAERKRIGLINASRRSINLKNTRRNAEIAEKAAVQRRSVSESTKSERAKISSETANAKDAVREEARSVGEAIRTKVASDVEKTRNEWVAKKDAIVQKYLVALDQAFKAAGGKGGNQSNAASNIPKRSTEERKAIREELRKQRTSKAA